MEPANSEEGDLSAKSCHTIASFNKKMTRKAGRHTQVALLRANTVSSNFAAQRVTGVVQTSAAAAAVKGVAMKKDPAADENFKASPVRCFRQVRNGYTGHCCRFRTIHGSGDTLVFICVLYLPAT